MCGIAGLTAPTDQPAMARMLQKLSHRGPDHQAIWTEPDGAMGGTVALACARLMTTDPDPSADQPLMTSDGKFVLVFNGYIAGHRRKIARLSNDGALPRSSSDAELVLQVLARAVADDCDVADILAGLSGQFALALWDRPQRRLWLACDPLGIKSLYVAHRTNGDIAFASELAALDEIRAGQFDDSIASDYFAHLFVPAPASGIRQTEHLKAGTVLCWQDGKTSRSIIAHPATAERARQAIPDVIADLRQHVRQSVADAMDVDCTLGCLVSGGLDSAGVAAIACDIARAHDHNPPPAFTMGFADPARDETDAARKLCAHLGLELNIVSAPQKADEIFNILTAALGAVGVPFANPAIVLNWKLSERVARDVRVCLSGDGGDELFGGYPRYRAARLFDSAWHYLPASLRRLSAHTGQGIGNRALSRFLTGGQGDAKTAFTVWNNRCAIGQLTAAWHPDDGGFDAKMPLTDQMMTFDRDVTLPGNQLVMADICGMAFGLEYRPPLLGHDIVRKASQVPAISHLRGGGKAVWREVVAPFLPDWHLRNRKIGFNPPVANWLAMLGPYIWGDETRILQNLFAHGGMTSTEQRKCWKRAISGRDMDMSLSVWALLVWAIWPMIRNGK